MRRTKTAFAGKLTEHQKVSDVFLVVQKNLALGRSNRHYLRLTLSDRTGQVEARVWDAAAELEPTFAKGDVVQVEGRVNVYQGVAQINVDKIGRVGEKALQGLSWADFLPAAERSPEEMWQELEGFLAEIQNPQLQRLVESFLADREFCEGFRNSPAAKGIHHVYVGGLLEHTIGVLRLASRLGDLYPVNRDLLLAGAFLHDIGKVQELSYRGGFAYTDAGRLLGHIQLGISMLREKAGTVPGFPSRLLLHLEHLLLSHHGELEWGSPKRPKTLEAMVLHAIDNLDAKIAGAAAWMAKSEGDEEGWTAYWKTLGRHLYRTPLTGPEFGDPGAVETLQEIEARWLQEAENPALEDDEPPPTGGPTRGRPPPGQGELGF